MAKKFEGGLYKPFVVTVLEPRTASLNRVRAMWSWSCEFTSRFTGMITRMHAFLSGLGSSLSATVKSIHISLFTPWGSPWGKSFAGEGKIGQITGLVSPHYFPNWVRNFVGEFSSTAIKQESHWQHTKEACASYRQYSCFPPALVNPEISEF
jgi:hypothetical protein